MKLTLVVLKFVHKFSDIPLFKRWSNFPIFECGLDLVTSKE